MDTNKNNQQFYEAIGRVYVQALTLEAQLIRANETIHQLQERVAQLSPPPEESPPDPELMAQGE